MRSKKSNSECTWRLCIENYPRPDQLLIFLFDCCLQLPLQHVVEIQLAAGSTIAEIIVLLLQLRRFFKHSWKFQFRGLHLINASQTNMFDDNDIEPNNQLIDPNSQQLRVV